MLINSNLMLLVIFLCGGVLPIVHPKRRSIIRKSPVCNQYILPLNAIWVNTENCEDINQFKCKKGYQSVVNTLCDNGNWNLEPTCQVPIRIIGGDYYGRLEVFLRGEWGTVCDDNFDQIEAVVACRQLGLPFSNAIPLSRARAILGKGTGPIWLDDTDCVGNETDITDCPSGELPGKGNCDHYEDAGVICLDEVPDDTVRVRLEEGPSEFEGRLEVLYGGLWGTVCVDGFTDNEAKVVCRMLGVTDVSNAIAVSFVYPISAGILWLDDMKCVGNETSITDCTFRSWGVTNCADEDVGINCQ